MIFNWRWRNADGVFGPITYDVIRLPVVAGGAGFDGDPPTHRGGRMSWIWRGIGAPFVVILTFLERSL